MGQVNSSEQTITDVKKVISQTLVSQAAQCGINANNSNKADLGVMVAIGAGSSNKSDQTITSNFNFSCIQDQQSIKNTKNAMKTAITEKAKQVLDGAGGSQNNNSKQVENSAQIFADSLDVAAMAKCASNLQSSNELNVKTMVALQGGSNSASQSIANVVDQKCVQTQLTNSSSLSTLESNLSTTSDQKATGFITAQSMASTCSCLFIVIGCVIFCLVMAETGGPKGGGGGGGGGGGMKGMGSLFGGGGGGGDDDGGGGGGMSGSLGCICCLCCLSWCIGSIFLKKK